MDLRWHTELELAPALRESVEQRIEELGAEHDDLIHVVIDVERTNHKNHGSAEAKIRCQAIGFEFIAHEHDEEPEAALQRTVDAFEREVRDRRGKRLDSQHQRHRRH